MKNRRNFYRVLHVQPEAPLEIIKASYRSLMTKLKAHPDLGGDHEAAVLINQAYAVLSNPEKRRQYDESRRGIKPTPRPQPQSAQPAPFDSPLRPRRAHTYSNPARAQTQRPAATPTPYAQCPFCGCAAPGPRPVDAHCDDCASPLTLRLAAAGTHTRELFGRRTAPRLNKTADLKMFPHWPHHGYPAQLRDVSSTGISLFAQHRPPVGQILKLEGRLLNGIARVVSVRGTAQGAVSIHALFLTAALAARTGAFVSEKA